MCAYASLADREDVCCRAGRAVRSPECTVEEVGVVTHSDDATDATSAEEMTEEEEEAEEKEEEGEDESLNVIRPPCGGDREGCI